jgi:Ran-binding protein 1
MENDIDVQFYPNVMALDQPKDSEKEAFSSRAQVFTRVNGKKTLICTNDLKIFVPKLSGKPRLLIADSASGELLLNHTIPTGGNSSKAKVESNQVSGIALDSVQGQGTFSASFKDKNAAPEFAKIFNKNFSRDTSTKKNITFKLSSSKPEPAKEKTPEPKIKPFTIGKSEKNDDPSEKLDSIFSGISKKTTPFTFGKSTKDDTEIEKKEEPKSANPGFNFTFNTPFSTKKDDEPSKSDNKPSLLFKPKAGGKSIFDVPSSSKTFTTKNNDNNANSGGDLARAQEEPSEITFKPLVNLSEVKNHDNGQTGDDIIFQHWAKIYHFDMDRRQWIDHGEAQLEISVDKKTRVAKTIGRDETTKKLRMCGRVTELADIQPMKKRACKWSMRDYTGTWMNEGKDIVVSVKFKDGEIRDKFVNLYKRAAKSESSIPPQEASAPPAIEPEVPASKADVEEKLDDQDFSWLPEVSKKGETLWETLSDVNEFSSEQEWTEGIVCRIKVCSLEGRFWVEIWDEQVDDLINIFTFQKDHLIKVQRNAAVWSCMDFAQDPEKIVTLCATFKSEVQAMHCQQIFESLRGGNVTLDTVKAIIDGSKNEEMPMLELEDEVEPIKVGVPSRPLFEEEEKPQTSTAPFKFSSKKETDDAPKASDDDAPKTNLFSSDIFGSSSDPPKSSLFGKSDDDSASKSIFGNDKPLFSFSGGDKDKEPSKPLFSFSSGGDDKDKPSGFSGFANKGGFADSSSSFGNNIFSNDSAATTFSFDSKTDSKPAFNPLAPKRATAEGETNGEDDFNGLDYTLQPIVSLEAKEVDSGDSKDEVIFEEMSKTYRLSKDTEEWKERGHGILRISKHAELGKFRIIQRDKTTQKLRVHHLIQNGMQVDNFQGKAQVKLWAANDFADGEPEIFSFCARFKTKEIADRFVEECKKAAAMNSSS